MPHNRSQHTGSENDDCICEADGGGGLWGLASIGAGRILAKNGVPIDRIAGASMGALVACLKSALVDPQSHCLSTESVDYMYEVAHGVRALEDVVEEVEGRTVLAVRRLLCPGGNETMYRAMMERGPIIPCYVEVARRVGFRKVSELFLEANPGDSMEKALQNACASAALKPKFGIDPVIVDGVEYLHDNSITRKSVNPLVAKLRDEGATKVIGIPISFMDTGRDDHILQRLYHLLRPSRSDLGDVVIRPKQGHGPTNLQNCLTNFGRGYALWPWKFARMRSEIGKGRRIAIPVEEFLRHGEEAADRAMPEIDRMLGRK